MAEHLALEQRLRDAAEIHLHKRTSGTMTLTMNGLGNEFLARATLTRDEDRRIGGSDAGDGRIYRGEGGKDGPSPRSPRGGESSGKS